MMSQTPHRARSFPLIFKRFWHPRQQIGCLLALLLLSGPCLLTPHAQGKTTSKNLHPIRDFLPPVANINSRLEETPTPQSEEQELEAIALPALSAPTIHTTPKVDRLSDDLMGQFKRDQLQSVLDIQKKVDEADLEHLWQATVEKNPVIRFSLEKLATPADLQTKQSSRFLSKTLNVLISGAAMGSTMLPGGGAYRNMGSMAVGNALQNIMNGKTQVAPGTLSTTEQIQLAGLIDELKLKLIHNYQNYKTTLQSLAQSRETTIKNNNLYSKALASHNTLAIMAAGSAYYQALSNETVLRQKAKLYRLELERMAGADAVKNLELAIHLPTDTTTASSIPHLTGPNPAEKPSLLPTSQTTEPQEKAFNSPLLGPEAPNSSNQTNTKAANILPDRALEHLPAPMEIGPSLSKPDNVLIGPLPPLSDPLVGPTAPHSASLRKINGRLSSKKSNAHPMDLQPQPIPDKILESSKERSL